MITFIVLLAGEELKHSKNTKQAIQAWAINLLLDAALCFLTYQFITV